MHKKGFLLLVLALSFVVLKAQDFQSKLFLGMAASQLSIDNMAGFNKPGVIVGGATNFKVADRIRFQQEISYYARGSRSSSEQQKFGNFSEFRFRYMDINLLFSYEFNEKYFVQFGATYGRLLSMQRANFSGVFENAIGDYKKSDIAPLIRIGYVFSPGWSVNLGYLRSVFTVTKAGTYQVHDSMNITLRRTISGGEQ